GRLYRFCQLRRRPVRERPDGALEGRAADGAVDHRGGRGRRPRPSNRRRLRARCRPRHAAARSSNAALRRSHAMIRRALLGIVLALLVPLTAFAQAWPAKPIRLIAPYPPGGQTDIVSRWLAERIGPALGQTILVENRTGAQGIVGLEAARASAPDGYTFVYVNLSNIALNPHVYPKLPYNALRDFAPVTQ